MMADGCDFFAGLVEAIAAALHRLGWPARELGVAPDALHFLEAAILSPRGPTMADRDEPDADELRETIYPSPSWTAQLYVIVLTAGMVITTLFAAAGLHRLLLPMLFAPIIPVGTFVLVLLRVDLPGFREGARRGAAVGCGLGLYLAGLLAIVA